MSEFSTIKGIEDPDIGLPTVSLKLGSYSAQIKEKRRKQNLTNVKNNWKKMIELVSTCTRHMNFGETDSNGDTTPY